MLQQRFWRKIQIVILLFILLCGYQSTVTALSTTAQTPAQVPPPPDDIPIEPTPPPAEETTENEDRGNIVSLETRSTSAAESATETAVDEPAPSSIGGAPNWFPNRDCSQQLRVMPLGDSITHGVGSSLPAGHEEPLTNNSNDPYHFGYRYYLTNALTTAGYHYDFVGFREHGGASTGITFPVDRRDHNGIRGIQGQELAPILLSGGVFRTVNYPPLLAADPTDIILLHVGTNDIAKANNQSEAEAQVDDVDNILDNIDTYSEDIVVIVASIIGQDPNDKKYDPNIVGWFNAELYTMVQSRIANNDKLIWVDMYHALDNSPTSTDFFDWLHPNNGGFNKMSAVWLAALQANWPTCIEITSTPSLTAMTDQSYIYQVTAVADPTSVTYALVNPPAGMTINANTGQITWTPTVVQVGANPVEVQATNGHQTDTQQFNIFVDGFQLYLPTVIK